MLLNDKYPWLCNTVRTDDVSCPKVNGRTVSESETGTTDGVTIQGLDLYGIKLVYYKVEHGPDRKLYSGYDRMFGEDTLELISRAFYFKGYMEQLPPNVRSYQLQGIWGQDIVTLYVARGSFEYYSTYGGTERNTPNVHEAMKTPAIGDIVYIPNNDTFYEILDVKEYNEAFGLASHSWTITMRVWKDRKLTIASDEDTMPVGDPVFDITTSAYSAQHQTNDILKLNDKLTDDFLKGNGNINMFDWTCE